MWVFGFRLTCRRAWCPGVLDDSAFWMVLDGLLNGLGGECLEKGTSVDRADGI